jgi:DNA-binding IscR family transcriptional regulator
MIRPMRLSHEVPYAICGVFDLAYNGRGETVQIRVISVRQAIPSRYLEQVFQRVPGLIGGASVSRGS